MSKIFQKVLVVTTNDENCKNFQKKYDDARRINNENKVQPKVIFEKKSLVSITSMINRIMNEKNVEKFTENQNEIENTAEKTKNSRKRIGNSATWKENVQREKCQSEKEYINKKSNVIPACSSGTCNSKCITKITAEAKEEINRQFWKLKDDKK